VRLDALTIANTETKSESGSSPMRLTMDNHTASIQEVYKYLVHNGQVLQHVAGEKSPVEATNAVLRAECLPDELATRYYGIWRLMSASSRGLPR